MELSGEIKKEERDIKEIFTRIKKRDFSGLQGLVLKNSIFQFSTNIIAKLGSLVFTIILARLLLPDLFGLYSLALSTILLFAGFSDLGLGQSIIKFWSQSSGRKDLPRAKSYFIHFVKIKLILLSVCSLALLGSAYFIANNYYNKPIFFALLAGSIYIFVVNLMGIFDALLQANDKFKPGMFREMITQTSRLILLPLIVFLSLQYFDTEIILSNIILSLAVVYTLSLIFISIVSLRLTNFFKIKATELSKKETKEANVFWLTISATILSGTFFGYIDVIILGRFVEGNIIGFYQAAFALTTSLTALVPFATVLFPVFSRLKGEGLQKGFHKSIRLSFMASFILILLTLIFAPFVVKVVYGPEYLLAAHILRLFSILIILFPLSSLYDSYFISQGKPRVIAKFLIISTILNIALNYVLITNLLDYSPFMASLGAAIATILSRSFYLGSLIINKKFS